MKMPIFWFLHGILIIFFSFTTIESLAQSKKKKTCPLNILANPASVELLEGNDFTTNRDFEDYLVSMHPSFGQDLRALGPDDIIMDGGADQAIFLRQYLFKDWNIVSKKKFRLPTLSKRAKAVAVAFKRPSEIVEEDFDPLTGVTTLLPATGNRFDYVTGDIKQLPENRPALVGKVSLIVDRFGILKYSHFQKTLEIYLKLLRVGGKIHFTPPDVAIFTNGTEVEFDKYLRAIKGVRLRFIPSPNYPSSKISAAKRGKFVLEKTSKNCEVPPLKLRSDRIDPDVGGDSGYDWEN